MRTSEILRILEKEATAPRNQHTAAICLAYRQLQQFRGLLLSVQVAIDEVYPQTQPTPFIALRGPINDMLE